MTRMVSALRDGETVEFEGAYLRMANGKRGGLDLVPGDLYIAERNSGPKLLTVKEMLRVSPDGKWAGWVVPVEDAYSFDLGECVGVEIVEASSDRGTP